MRIGKQDFLRNRFAFRAEEVPLRLADLEYGAQRMTKSTRVWTGTVRSAGASALRIHFTDVRLPAGAELYVYNANGVAFGPYTDAGPLGSGEFWSNTVIGDTVMVCAGYV